LSGFAGALQKKPRLINVLMIMNCNLDHVVIRSRELAPYPPVMLVNRQVNPSPINDVSQAASWPAQRWGWN